ncbi:2-polyprenyl-6-methoxyphenol hydroxylase-like FAD-dependent oxidoreductase [Actinocrispum wychmicini]|uniref:2-polyprenyl-6-methoxyphenol hydroxylase-like FAD-dependent oxidoreductase n=2 Tax=Actinocrispum wychmicini TaxID=1213861 RepID=A0A4R2J7T2_9PSEU|nr:2-polyprenyl-6-methoxyphenol hydroxylase-like FAD-dependent oxidoreductase [Actinocrispum wychmicini]
MLLALGLQRHGYEMTVIAERTAEELRTGRVISNQCIFERALQHERSQGLNFWDEKAPPVNGIAFGAGQPGVPEPVIRWESPLEQPAQSVDQRLKMSDWLTEFARRGGEIRHDRVEPDGLAALAREFDLVLVAAGRGPQFGRLFARRPELSPFTGPQRAIALMYLTPNQPEFYQGVTFALAPDGEWFSLPVLSVTGPVYGVYFSGYLGGPLDCWDDIRDVEHFFEVATKAVDRHFPWLAPILRNTAPNGPLDYLKGKVTPVVRDPVGTLDFGAKVLAMGDTAVTNDPIAGQGANMAAHCAAAYQQTILDQGDRPFDEEFMRRAFDRFWQTAKHAVRFSNDLLSPPPPHVLATFQAAQENPVVAHRFAALFNDNSDYTAWLTDEKVAMAYLASLA